MALTDQEVQAAWTQLTTQTDLSTLEEGAIAAISAAPAERQAQAQSFLTLEKSLWEFGQTATGADLQRAQAQSSGDTTCSPSAVPSCNSPLRVTRRALASFLSSKPPPSMPIPASALRPCSRC